ncbi:MAG: hypothetical protein GXO29_05825 [Thermotogae bacterium]|nr:hypothetical protein [Thermotogota bacterium]
MPPEEQFIRVKLGNRVVEGRLPEDFNLDREKVRTFLERLIKKLERRNLLYPEMLQEMLVHLAIEFVLTTKALESIRDEEEA